ncbi:DUF3515 domain-containing protein [Neomicrococcus aestuarii]|uniref:DUF3515 domain-containing protein n=1 Tax=Neomicrococcus aestuarii TaxID=556325 RepID=UPI001E540F47|nr:DUF3515 domain-containing protein [Neomicrococcus aestuarii]
MIVTRRRKLAAISLTLATSTLLAGCASAVSVDAADDANNPECAEFMVLLPQELAGFERRDTTSQATAAYGDPAAVIIRCGVASPPPSTDPCATVNGVDWLTQEGDPAWTLTTYGRSPAVEVLLDPDEVASSSALVSLTTAASQLPQVSHCLSVDQDVTLP